MKKGKTIFSTIAIMFILVVSIVNAEPVKTIDDDGTITLTYENGVKLTIERILNDEEETVKTKITYDNGEYYLCDGIFVDGTNEVKDDNQNTIAKISEDGKTIVYLTKKPEGESTFENFIFESIEKEEIKEEVPKPDEELLETNDGKLLKITESEAPSSEEEQVEKKEKTTQIEVVVPPGFKVTVKSILYNERGGFSNAEFKDYTLTYTTKDTNGNPIDVAIVYNKDGTAESTTKKYDNNIIYFEEGDKKLEISQELGIKTIDYEKEAYIATVADGSQGTLTEDGTKFTYDIEEGSNVKHTLQLLDGGGTLEFHNKNTEEGDGGTITITRGSEKLKFYGTFDGKEVKEKDKKILAIDENGNILTDFDKNGNPQTIYYAHNVFGAYVFGRKQTDGSEKIYSAGYVPFAFKAGDGKIIMIKKQEDGSYKYFLNGEELNEDDPKVKEAKAMVTKSLIGPAFDAAVSAARGGIALSNLLNTWLDIDFITNWRKKADEFFSGTVIGRIISGKWEESICHYHIEKIPDSIAVVNVNNVIGFAAHVEGERSSAITTNNETLYFYKITFGVNPYGMGNITFELLIDGNAVDLDNDGMADKIKLEADKTYSGTGENAVVRYKDKIYEEVCLKFYNTENLNLEFRNALKDNKLCNKIVEVDLSSVEISKPASSTTISSTSTGQPGW